MQKHDAVRARQTLSPPPLRRCLSVRQTTERILTKIELIAKSCNRAVGFNFAATSYNSPLYLALVDISTIPSARNAVVG